MAMLSHREPHQTLKAAVRVHQMFRQCLPLSTTPLRQGRLVFQVPRYSVLVSTSPRDRRV